MKLQKVKISAIKFDDDVYSLTPSLSQTAPKKLVQSIGRVGLLHPPIIVEIAEGIYRIGSGRKRLLAAKELHIQTCQCNVFTATTHPVDVYSYIYEEASHTDLPLISKAIFLKKTGQWRNANELSEKFMSGFGLKPGKFNVEKLQKLAGLEINIQEELLQNRIDEKVCHELVKLDFIDRMGLFDIITSLSLSVGNQRKLLIASREVATRNKIAIATFLGQPPLTTILTSQSFNIPQKSSNFMAKLEELRFPLLSEAEHEFKMFVRTLPLSKKMSISHSLAFEKDELSLTITCDSRKEISEVVERLNEGHS